MICQKLIVPTAILYGADAKNAVKQGIALPIAGGFSAFGMVKIIHRHHSDVEFMSLAELRDGDDVEIKKQLNNITAARRQVCGLEMSRPHIMGILNITPDSFSDGGSHANLLQLEQQIDEYIRLGVSILDIGGESTRPNAAYVKCDDEIARIAPVLELLSSKNICVSVDTRKAKVMEFALGAGADIVNDVSALEFRADEQTYGEDSGDSELLILKKKCPIILMHSQGTPKTMQDNPNYENILFEIYDYLQNRIQSLTDKGFDLAQIIVDPGIGFGKTAKHCLTILNHLCLFHSLGVPLLLGASRKSFMGQVDGQMDASKRLGGSLATAHIGLSAGVQWHRMHDIEQSVQQNQIVNAIYDIV